MPCTNNNILNLFLPIFNQIWAFVPARKYYMNSTYILGSGGHALKVAKQLHQSLADDETLAGFISTAPTGQPVFLDYEVKFNWVNIPPHVSLQDSFFHSAIGDPFVRFSMHNQALAHGMKPRNIISTQAVFIPDKAGLGCFAGYFAVIEVGAELGTSVLIDNNAIIEHHCQIGDFVNISPGAILCGGVSVGDFTVIGAGAALREKVKIGNNVVIGAGSTVVSDIPDYAVAFGNPARVMRYREPEERIYR
jgi:sugar O-acyltransferase (sialic acid O-acetyltransferase NeuD family)